MSNIPISKDEFVAMVTDRAENFLKIELKL